MRNQQAQGDSQSRRAAIIGSSDTTISRSEQRSECSAAGDSRNHIGEFEPPDRVCAGARGTRLARSWQPHHLFIVPACER
jgi:hypothetical protein